MSTSSSQDACDARSNDDDSDGVDYTKRLLEGSGSVFSGSMVGKVIGFTLNLVLTRGLGTTLYGLYSLGLTVLRIAESIGSLGLQNGIVRFAAPLTNRDEPGRLKGTFLTGGGIGFATGLLLGGILFASAPWFANRLFGTPEMVRVIRIFACGLPFYVFTYLASRMARALGRMRVDVLLDAILQPALFLLLASGALLAGLGLSATLYAFLLSTILAAGASIYAIARLFPPLLSRIPPEFNPRPLLRFSLPIVGVTLATIGLTYTDRIMLGIFSTAEVVGVYQAAARTSSQLLFALFPITAAFSPIISDLYHNEKRQQLAELYADTVRWIILITLPATLVLFTFAPQVMSIYGPGFRDGGILLRILSVAYFIAAGVGSAGHMLQMSDHQDFVFLVNTTMAILNVGLNWILILFYGAIGAAVATALTQALGNIAQAVAIYYFLEIQPFRRPLWKPAVAAMIAGVSACVFYVILSSPARWLIGIPTILLVYGGTLLGLGLHKRDHSIVAALWDRFGPSLSW